MTADRCDKPIRGTKRKCTRKRGHDGACLHSDYDTEWVDPGAEKRAGCLYD